MKNILVLLLFAPLFFATALEAASPTSPAKQDLVPRDTPVEYVMPYPGLLPTHPLYFLKTIRDRIIELLISDRVKKAEFYILQADKKVGMANILMQQGKKKDAITSFDHAMTQRVAAVNELENVKKAGSTIPGHVIEKLKRSILKHKEQTGYLGDDKQPLDALFTRAEILSTDSALFSP